MSFKNSLIYYLFLAVLGLCCCTGISLVVVSRGYSPVVVCGLLIAAASLGFRAQAAGPSEHMGSVVAAPGL